MEIGGLAQPRTRILPTKVIRILSFAPDLENPKADDEIQDPAERGEDERVVLPEVNTMRSDLIQLIAMLEGEPELEDDVQVEMGEDVGEELGLEEWLGEEGEDGEWEDEEEGEAGEQGRSTGRQDLEDVD